MTWIINTSLPVKYRIKKSINLFDVNNKDILTYGQPQGRRMIVIDLKVSNLYLKEIIHYFEYHNIDYHIVNINAVEKEKNIENLLYLLKQMEQYNLNRRSEPVIAVGGGVLLDIVGLGCSLYRRGIPYIRVPTTLIGLVDACIGSKTAVNFMDRRNRIGQYYPPIISYLDKTFLQTLEPVEISSGLGEILKIAVIKDFRLFHVLKAYGRRMYKTKFNDANNISDKVIDKAIQGMKEELEDNLWETNLERCVDFGHSFSPILEIRSLTDSSVPSLTHGQAVTLDMIFSCILSRQRKMMTEQEVNDVISVANSMELPTNHPYFNNPSYLMEALYDTVKHRNGNQYLPIPTTIGKHVFLNDITFNEIKKASGQMKGETKTR